MQADTILAIDNGTQSVRAIVIDLQGQILAKSKILMEEYQTPQLGWSECDPRSFWRDFNRVCQDLWATSGFDRKRLACMVVTTQRASVFPVTAQGEPTRAGIMWMDRRRATAIPKLGFGWRWLFRLLRLEETITDFQKDAEANWIAENEPDIWAKTDKFLVLSGYLHYRLCGEFVDAIPSQIGYLPFDFKGGKWAASWDWKSQGLKIRPSMLPKLVKAGELIGHVHAKAAAESGIPEGLPIIAGAADKACEVLGAGCHTPQEACLSYGTAATINICTAKYTEPLAFVPAYPSAYPNHYNMETQIYRGFWLVSWFKQEFGLSERLEAEGGRISPEQLFDKLIENVPAGSDGLLLQPFWNPGVKIPGPEAKGSIIGFADVHGRSHIYKAILEGIGYALREAKERMEKRTKVPITRLMVAGGGSQSNQAMQITANLFNLPAARPHTFEASALGAAILGAVGMKLYPDIPTAIAKMTHRGDIFYPQPKEAELYDKIYRRVYSKLYQQMKPLYQNLRDIFAKS